MPIDQIQSTFKKLRCAKRKALIPFIMAGDPSPAQTPALLKALADAGADILELGVPFSDPLADGPTIQRASQRALSRGMTPQRVLKIVQETRKHVDVPIVLLTYWNPVAQFGNRNGAINGLALTNGAAFLKAASEAGVSGLVIPDLPPDEAKSFEQAAEKAGVATVFLATPTSSPERLRMIARASKGFIYYVSLTGTTGARTKLPPQWLHGVRQLKLLTTKPVCVGFGISTPAQAAAVARAADGVIVGSALIKHMEGRSPASAIRRAAAFVTKLRKAV